MSERVEAKEDEQSRLRGHLPLLLIQDSCLLIFLVSFILNTSKSFNNARHTDLKPAHFTAMKDAREISTREVILFAREQEEQE